MDTKDDTKDGSRASLAGSTLRVFFSNLYEFWVRFLRWNKSHGHFISSATVMATMLHNAAELWSRNSSGQEIVVANK